MDAIPLASGSLDYVYCCEVLHHNDRASLRRTFAEVFRVLRPGGRLLVVNETLKTLRDPHGVHDEGVEQFEGYEHAHWALRYRWEATRAGFLTEVTEPHYRSFFGDATLELPPGTPALKALGRRCGFALRRNGLARRVYLAWLEPRVGGSLDEHDRDQAAALRRPARGDGDGPAAGARARRRGAPALRSPRGPRPASVCRARPSRPREALRRARLEVLRDLRRRAVEHPEAEREGPDDDRQRPQQPGPAADRRPGAGRGVGDHRVAELLEDGDQRVEHVEVKQERVVGDAAFRERSRPG